jgi:hypothetical protein
VLPSGAGRVPPSLEPFGLRPRREHRFARSVEDIDDANRRAAAHVLACCSLRKWRCSSSKSLAPEEHVAVQPVRDAPLGEAAMVRNGAAYGDLVGYSVLEAGSRNAVVELLHDHPHFHTPEGEVELHEMLPVPGT